MAWCLVSPANRGIGFSLTRYLLENTKAPVIATARKDIDNVKRDILDDLPDIDPKRLTILELDVTDENSISAAAAEAKALFPPSSHHLRLSFSIPGILHPEKSPAQLDADNILNTFKINTIGPMLIMKHFSPFLPKKKTTMDSASFEGLPAHAVYAIMSARVGSTSDNSLGGWYSYRASKAGVNSITKTFDLWLKTSAGDKAMAIALHPGTVKTGLSKDFWAGVQKEKLFSPEFAAEKLMEVVKGLSPEEGRGKCWDWQGKEIRP